MSETHYQVFMPEETVTFQVLEFPQWEVKAHEVKSTDNILLYLNWPHTILFDSPPTIYFKKETKTVTGPFKKFLEDEFKVRCLSAEKNQRGFEFAYCYDPSYYTEGYQPPANLWNHLFVSSPKKLFRITPDTNVEKDHGMNRSELAKHIIQTFEDLGVSVWQEARKKNAFPLLRAKVDKAVPEVYLKPILQELKKRKIDLGLYFVQSPDLDENSSTITVSAWHAGHFLAENSSLKTADSFDIVFDKEQQTLQQVLVKKSK